MKKLILLALIVGALFVSVACSSLHDDVYYHPAPNSAYYHYDGVYTIPTVVYPASYYFVDGWDYYDGHYYYYDTYYYDPFHDEVYFF